MPVWSWAARSSSSSMAAGLPGPDVRGVGWVRVLVEGFVAAGSLGLASNSSRTSKGRRVRYWAPVVQVDSAYRPDRPGHPRPGPAPCQSYGLVVRPCLVFLRSLKGRMCVSVIEVYQLC